MKVFAISDLHLSSAVQKPMDIFGDGWQNHFQKISADWKSKVTEGDLVLLGGDMSWGLTIEEAQPDFDLVGALPGKKFVVKGNHDYYWNSLSKMRTAFENFEFIQNNAYRISLDGTSQTAETSKKKQKQYTTPQEEHFPKGVVICGTRGWSVPSKDTSEQDNKIFEREVGRLELSLSYAEQIRQEGDILIIMLHYPPFEADYANTKITELIKAHNANYVLYGHLHGKNARVTPIIDKDGTKYILTSCDLVGHKLIEVCEL